MPKRIIKALIGGFKPGRPKRSLPSYKDPTPESNPRLSREEEAEAALKHTSFTPGTPLFLVTLFLVTIASVPVIQFATELRARQSGASLRMFDVVKALPSWSRIESVRNLHEAWSLLPHAEELKNAEKELESDAVVSQWLLPGVQSVLVGGLRAGNEQVYLGRDGWLFYRPDVDYVTARPFLEPARLRQRAHAARVQPDPLKAILQFHEQLASRGIELVVVPIPTKASIEGEKLSSRARHAEALQNGSFADFKAQLAAAGVRVFDTAPQLMAQKAAAVDPLYLTTDTHWRPEIMESVAHQLAASLQLPPVTGEAIQISPHDVTAVGDIARMLKLPAASGFNRPEKVTTHQVAIGNNLWRSNREADVLLLGDSFANIFSLDALGWGDSAGFAEHLSFALGGRPLDCILRNSDGAFSTREMLANELARGRDRLAGKKLVIWEFAARELAFGNWKLLDLKVGPPVKAAFFSPNAGEKLEVTGVVDVVSSVPRPGTVPYKDHVMAIQLSDVQIPSRGEGKPMQALVYLSSMRDNIWTAAARLRPGDHVTVRLRAWSDLAPQYEQINRSEIDDPAVQLEEPAWGEIVE